MAIIQGTDGADNLVGTPGDETFFYSPDANEIDGGDGFDTVRYADFVPIVARFQSASPSNPNNFPISQIQVEKFPQFQPGDLDLLKNIEKIVASPSQEDAIDVSRLISTGGKVFLVNTNVDLSANQITINGTNIQLRESGFDLYALRSDRQTEQDQIADVTITSPSINRRLSRFADPGSNGSTLTFSTESGETILDGLFTIAWVG